MHRLHTAERGQLDVSHAAITAPQFNQCWTLDPTGNWQGFRQDGDGSGTWDLIQARTANPVNEITGIDNTAGSSWATPAYDANGNTTSLPRPDLGADKSTATIWDAWNRPVRFRDPDTDQTLVELGYDARNFRILHRPFAAGVAGDARHFYFTDQWQAIEERLASSTTPERQHIWGLRYIDDLLLRDRAPSGSGTLDERLYFLADANWNITAVVDVDGTVQERIEYTPYGLPQFLSLSFGDRVTSLYDIRYSYTGREWLPKFALYYFRNRLYSPRQGTFMSRDPIGYAGSPRNLCAYVLGQPLTAVDPTGNWPWDAGCSPGTRAIESTAISIAPYTWGDPSDLEDAFAAIEDIDQFKNIVAILTAIPSGGTTVMIAAVQSQLPNVNIEVVRAIIEVKRRLSADFSGASVYTKVTFKSCEERCGLFGKYTTWVTSTTEYKPCGIGNGLKTSDGGVIYMGFQDAMEKAGECAEAHANSIIAGS